MGLDIPAFHRIIAVPSLYGCDDCGAAVTASDVQLHREWHAKSHRAVQGTLRNDDGSFR